MAELATAELDIPKLLLFGSGAYSLLATILYPLSVVKTLMQSGRSNGVGAVQVVRDILGRSGVRGLFAGLGPMLCGALPARTVYIFGLERAKAAALRVTQTAMPPAPAAAVANAAGGLVAGGTSQLVYVPFDVVTQQMMVSGESAPSVVRSIVAANGLRGLYRGLNITLIACEESSPRTDPAGARERVHAYSAYAFYRLQIYLARPPGGALTAARALSSLAPARFACQRQPRSSSPPRAPLLARHWRPTRPTR